MPNITVDPATFPAGSCVPGTPALNETIDDLVIFAVLDSIDGPGKILGQAGPCFIRLPGYLPLIGAMRFDTADVATLESAGQFDEVILHEMGHVLGFGTIWGPLGLLADPASAGGTDPHFVGPQAVAAWLARTAWRFCGMSQAAAVRNRASDSRALVRGQPGPLEELTARELLSALDAALRASRGGAAQSLGDDILKLPIRVVDRSGRIVRVIRP